MKLYHVILSKIYSYVRLFEIVVFGVIGVIIYSRTGANLYQEGSGHHSLYAFYQASYETVPYSGCIFVIAFAVVEALLYGYLKGRDIPTNSHSYFDTPFIVSRKKEVVVPAIIIFSLLSTLIGCIMVMSHLNPYMMILTTCVTFIIPWKHLGKKIPKRDAYRNRSSAFHL